MERLIAVNSWFSSRLGRSLLAIEHEYLRQILPNLFGFYILQIGSLGGQDFLRSSRIRFRTIFDFPGSGQQSKFPLCDPAYLPIDTQSIDVVVLPHVLEFVDEPHHVLREAERVLLGEGYLIIVGFNPVSTWGLFKMLYQWHGKPPWNGRFHALPKTKDWLRLLGFDIVKSRCFYCRPPLTGLALSPRLAGLEKVSKVLWPWCGGAYVVVAKKRLVRLIPMKQRWRVQPRLVSGGFAEPSARSVDEIMRSKPHGPER